MGIRTLQDVDNYGFMRNYHAMYDDTLVENTIDWSLDLNFGEDTLKVEGGKPINFDRSGDVQTYVTPDEILTTEADELAASTWGYNATTGRWEPKGAQFWESRTNRLTYSEDLTNAAWTKSAITISADAIAAPDGNTTADGNIATAASSAHYVKRPYTATTGLSYTISAYGKAGDNNYLNLRTNPDGGGYRNTTINLTTGAVEKTASSIDGVEVKILGGGWFRMIVTLTLSGGVTNLLHTWAFLPSVPSDDNIPTYTGDASTINGYLWGAQLEEAASAGPYIPTTSAQVNRSADDASMDTAGWYAGQGTILVDLEFPDSDYSGFRMICAISDGTTNNRIYLARNTDGGLQAQINTGGVTQAQIAPASGAALHKGKHRIALAFTDDDIRMVMNGDLKGSDSSSTMPGGIITMNIAANVTLVQLLDGTISRLRYTPEILTTAQMEALTANP